MRPIWACDLKTYKVIHTGGGVFETDVTEAKWDWDWGYEYEKKPKSPCLVSLGRPNVQGSGFGF